MKIIIPTIFFKTALLASAIFTSPFASSVVLYDESISGDGGGGVLYTLSDTHNLYNGNQSHGSDDVTDGLRFVVQSGYQATVHVNYSITTEIAGMDVAYAFDLWKLPDGAGSCIPPNNKPYACAGPGSEPGELLTISLLQTRPDFQTIGIPIPNLDTLVLQAGTYAFNDNFVFGAFNTATLNYSIDIQQTAVPLPSAAWLFGSGFLGLTGLIRSRR